ncbi:DNA mismatch repair protein MutS, partial [bacterium]|nr:DNA mismatch repair protein MutS [bacterium]
MAKKTRKLFTDKDIGVPQTPAMRQYANFKKQHPDAVLFFRMGDFFETFFDDAKICSRVCGLTLTSRAQGEGAVPLAGFPYHSIDTYLKRLITAGYKVAVCEQVQDPREAKGVVDRDVVRVVTPGTLTEEALLDAKANNFLAAIALGKERNGIAWVDLSTGRFLVQEVDPAQTLDELGRIGPAECLMPDSQYRSEDSLLEPVREIIGGLWTPRPDWAFDPGSGQKALREHFGVATLEGFGCDGLGIGLGAAGAVLDYLQETQRGSLDNITKIQSFAGAQYLMLDKATQQSLELVETLRSRRQDTTLIGVLDETVTAMGGRLFRQMVLYPLREVAAIQLRQDAVGELVGALSVRDSLRAALRGVYDIERLASKIAYRRANARDLVGLRESAAALPGIRAHLADVQAPLLRRIHDNLDTLDDLRDLVQTAIVDDPPTA